MNRLHRTAIAGLAAASLLGALAAPAPAAAEPTPPPCDSIPECVNLALDTAEEVYDALQGHPEEPGDTIRREICGAYELGTGAECPPLR